jgi:hypothetical protein
MKSSISQIRTQLKPLLYTELVQDRISGIEDKVDVLQYSKGKIKKYECNMKDLKNTIKKTNLQKENRCKLKARRQIS